MLILDPPTLLQLLDAPPEAVRQTIETGGWSGCLWPGHPEWDEHEVYTQVLSLATHYLTVRHPTADRRRRATAAQLLACHAFGPTGGVPLDEEVLYQHAHTWLWALAGAIPASQPAGFVLPPPLDAMGQVLLPGGDPIAFTEAALALIEALLFSGEVAAQQVAATFLRAHPGELAQRAMAIVDAVARHGMERAVDEEVTCTGCGASDLEVWYTGQTWGDTLCATCYEARVVQGQARPTEA